LGKNSEKEKRTRPTLTGERETKGGGSNINSSLGNQRGFISAGVKDTFDFTCTRVGGGARFRVRMGSLGGWTGGKVYGSTTKAGSAFGRGKNQGQRSFFRLYLQKANLGLRK